MPNKSLETMPLRWNPLTKQHHAVDCDCGNCEVAAQSSKERLRRFICVLITDQSGPSSEMKEREGGPYVLYSDIAHLIDSSETEVPHIMAAIARTDETAADALEYRLPCNVRLPPSTVITRGCPLRTVLESLRQREGLPEEPQFIPEHSGNCGPNTPWDRLCGEPSCSYCGLKRADETECDAAPVAISDQLAESARCFASDVALGRPHPLWSAIEAYENARATAPDRPAKVWPDGTTKILGCDCFMCEYHRSAEAIERERRAVKAAGGES